MGLLLIIKKKYPFLITMSGKGKGLFNGLCNMQMIKFYLGWRGARI